MKKFKIFSVLVFCAVFTAVFLVSSFFSYAATSEVAVGNVSSMNSDGYYEVEITVSNLSLSSKKYLEIELQYNNLAFSIVKTQLASSVKSYTTLGSNTDIPYKIRITAGSSALKVSGVVCTVYFKPIGLLPVNTYNIVPTVTLQGGTVDVSSGSISVTCSHEYAPYSTVESTCIAGGYSLERCSKCESFRRTEEKEPLGHDYKQIDTKAPSCTEYGYTIEECTRCQLKNIIEGDPPVGHEYGIDDFVIIEPSCSSQGYTEYHCLREGCTATNRLDYTDMTDHEEGEAVTVDSTCQKHGSRTTYCKYCGMTMNEESLELVPHSFEDTVVDATCTSRGYTLRTCTLCGTIRREVPTEKLPHTYVSIKESESGCETPGRIRYTCSCGDSYVEETASLGHSYVRESVIYPTDESDGMITSSCSVCGDVRHEIVPAGSIIDGGSDGGEKLDVHGGFKGALTGRQTLLLNITAVLVCFAAASVIVFLIRKTFTGLILDKK